MIKTLIDDQATEALSLIYFLGNDEFPSYRDEIISKFQHDGRWREFGYKIQDDKYGYWGIIPACFWLNALHRKKNKDRKDFEVMHETINNLLETENNGYVRKTQYNRNDVLNTNLLVAYTLFKCTEDETSGSYLKVVSECVIRRIVFRVLLSQNRNGSFPYQSNSRHVSLVYHFMVHALLAALSNYIRSPILAKALHQSNGFIDHVTKNGEIIWEKDTSNDKLRIIWAYAWLQACGRKHIKESQISKLISFVYENKYFPDEFEARDIAWCNLALWVQHDTSTIQPANSNRFFWKFFIFLFIKVAFKMNLRFKKVKSVLTNKIFYRGHEPF